MESVDHKQIFSDNLKYYLDLHGKKQIDLINDLKLNRSTVSTWVRGGKLPKMDTVQLLADYFNTNLSDLLEENKGLYLKKRRSSNTAPEGVEECESKYLEKDPTQIPIPGVHFLCLCYFIVCCLNPSGIL